MLRELWVKTYNEPSGGFSTLTGWALTDQENTFGIFPVCTRSKLVINCCMADISGQEFESLQVHNLLLMGFYLDSSTKDCKMFLVFFIK